MSSPIHFQHFWKRYQMGSKHDSLRDAIPAFFQRFVRRGESELKENEFWAVRDVTFDVKRGETLGIIGPNGAGKSTILKLLSRITEPTQGAMKVQGRLAALIELGGGFHPDLTGAENVYLQGTMLGLRNAEIKRQFDSIVAFSELDSFLYTPVKRYSSGMIVRLGFAIAAQIHPEVLLIDEVLAVGDLSFQQKCFKRIAELQEAGTTIIFISHNLEAVQKLCDRALLLRGGQVAAEGNPGEMIRVYREDVLGKNLERGLGVPQELLHGDGAFQIRQFLLKDADGASVNSLATGQFLRVEIHYQAAKPIHNPSFRIAIERLDGLLCHAATSQASGLSAGTLTGGGVLTLEYPAINLLPNLYQVRFEAYEGSNPVPLANVHRGPFFQISTDHQEQGAFHLEHRWTLEP